eukprot:GHVH01010038.1.p1 GENE.GHVH01010038.1~~GHVH01010038.1.p1  ORF type:complete len:276 (+),score=47.48 GHVH01010038.1:64-891(+)
MKMQTPANISQDDDCCQFKLVKYVALMSVQTAEMDCDNKVDWSATPHSGDPDSSMMRLLIPLCIVIALVLVIGSCLLMKKTHAPPTVAAPPPPPAAAAALAAVEAAESYQRQLANTYLSEMFDRIDPSDPIELEGLLKHIQCSYEHSVLEELRTEALKRLNAFTQGRRNKTLFTLEESFEVEKARREKRAKETGVFAFDEASKAYHNALDRHCPEEELEESRAVCLKAFSALPPVDEITSTFQDRKAYAKIKEFWTFLENWYDQKQIKKKCMHNC